MQKTKKNPKKALDNSKLYTIIISVVAAFVAVMTLITMSISLGWFSPVVDDNGVAKLDYNELNEADKWEASYVYLDGRMTKQFSAGIGTKTLILEFETESGDMNLMVYDKQTGVAIDYKGSPMYYNSVGNATYEVKFRSDVVVRLDAVEHRGRFSIRVE